MSDVSEKQQAAIGATTSAAELRDTTKVAPASPARSDKSSDSEGKNVREKLKDTQIDAQATSDPVPTSDQAMKDAPNGSAKVGDQSVSGSDSERGRLRRKRSHEDFEEAEAGKLPGNKVEGHKRKRSRDITKDIEAFVPSKPVSPTIVEEDEQMTSPNKTTSSTTDKASGTDTSPKNKRTRDQIEKDTEATAEGSEAASANGKPVEKASDERDTKRLRDKEAAQTATDTAESKTKMPPTSGFSNTSAASPFAAMASSKPQAPKFSDKAGSLAQTSDDKSKPSVFGSFGSSASSTASPFGGFGSSKPSTSSPFGAATGGKLSSFAGSPAAPTNTGFGGSTFGGASGAASSGSFSFGGAKTGLSSFASPGAPLEIKGLKSTTKAVPFGATQLDEDSDSDADDDDGGEDDPLKEADKKERQTSQSLLSQQPQETGEEGEETLWTGRAKLYIMGGEGTTRGWKERGTGTFKFNMTVEAPKRARFVLRAEGTHRLLLNAAVTRNMVFGGDAQGEKPKDNRLLFNSPNADGEIEMHLLKLKPENAVNLWEEVIKVQEQQL